MRISLTNFTEFIKNLIVLILALPYILLKLFTQIIKKVKVKKHGLLIFFEVYFIITILLFYFGPISYPGVNNLKTISLLILYNIFFVLGYLFADKKILLVSRKKPSGYSLLNAYILIGGIISIFFSFVSLVNYSNSFNPIIIFKDIQLGLVEPGQSYFRNIEIEKESGIITQLMTLLSPISYSVIPLGLFYFKKISINQKLLVILVIILDLCTFIIKGTNFGIFKITIIFITIFLVNKSVVKLNNASKTIIVFALIYFLVTITGRMQLATIPYTIFDIPVDHEHLLFKLLPLSLSISLMLGISYISQGYYGLSLSTMYDFQPTFGFGSGGFLISNMERISSIDIWERTYQARMDMVWDSRVNWHTIYVWFANDVGLYGVIIIMGILGFLFCLVLKDVRENRSLLGIILLPLYLIMLFFIPANNIIFDNPLLFVPFAFFNIIWAISRHWRVRT